MSADRRRRFLSACPLMLATLALVAALSSCGGGSTVAPPPPPIITGITPASGPDTGGTTVTISGTNFENGATVLFGKTAATASTFVSGSQLTAVSPAETVTAPTAVTVQVTNPDGQVGSLSNAFTFLAPPTITGLSPTSGPDTGGTTVTISGTNFENGATVLFGKTAATAVTFVSSTDLTVVTPAASAPGPVSVTVTNPDGQTGSLSPGFSYTGSHSVSLSWDASTSQIIGYNVYRSAVSGGPYTKIMSLVDSTCMSGSTCTYTDNSVAGNTTYYYVVTAVDPNNVESVYSNQAGPAAVPGP